MLVSISFLKKFMACPLQARFAYIDGLKGPTNAAAEFGSAVHVAMETYVTTLDVDKAREHFLAEWKEANPDEYPPYTSYGKYKKQGVKILENYAAKDRWTDRTLIATEHPFLVPFGEHQIHGVVDLVVARKNSKNKLTLQLLDFKTNGRQPSKAMLRHDAQFSTYLYASRQPEFFFGHDDRYPALPNAQELWDTYKDVPRRGIWVHLRGPKEIDVGERNDQDFRRLYRIINEVDKAMKNNVFVPDMSAQTCDFCPFWEPCGLQIPKGPNERTY